MADNKDKDLQDNQEEQENKDESTNTDTSSSDDKNESGNVDTDKQDNKEGDDKKDDTSNVDDTNDDTDNKTVPYSRFKEKVDEVNALKQQLADLQANQSNNTDESTNTDNAELEQYKAAFNELFQSKLEQVPEEYQDLIPDGDELSKLNWIDSAISKGLFTTKKVESFGNKANNPAEQEKEDNTSFIRGLGRRF